MYYTYVQKSGCQGYRDFPCPGKWSTTWQRKDVGSLLALLSLVSHTEPSSLSQYDAYWVSSLEQQTNKYIYIKVYRYIALHYTQKSSKHWCNNL